MSDPVPEFESLVEAGARRLYLMHRGNNPDWPVGLDKHGYHQEPYVSEVPSWQWFYASDARAILAAVLPLVVGPARESLTEAADKLLAEFGQVSNLDNIVGWDDPDAFAVYQRATTTSDQLTRLIQTKEGGDSDG